MDKAMKYHQFSFKPYIDVIIAEPIPRRYIWLSRHKS